MIGRILKGDKDAFDALVRKYYTDIYRYCYRRTNGGDLAADLTQEVFMKLIASIYRYRHSGKFRNYLFTIAVNTCNDHLRKRTPRAAGCDVDAIADERGDPAESLPRDEEAKVLRERIDSLPDIQRDALILYYFHGMKAKDVAVVTQVPLATAKSRIRQGMNKLRNMYKE